MSTDSYIARTDSQVNVPVNPSPAEIAEIAGARAMYEEICPGMPWDRIPEHVQQFYIRAFRAGLAAWQRERVCDCFTDYSDEQAQPPATGGMIDLPTNDGHART